jgi:hypothetical protein
MAKQEFRARCLRPRPLLVFERADHDGQALQLLRLHPQGCRDVFGLYSGGRFPPAQERRRPLGLSVERPHGEPPVLQTCCIYPYHGGDEYGYRVNLGCVEGLDPLALEIALIDGRSMDLAPDPGPHPGDVSLRDR